MNSVDEIILGSHALSAFEGKGIRQFEFVAKTQFLCPD